MTKSSKNAAGVCSITSERTEKIRKEYRAASIEAVLFELDVITTSDGGENGWGVKWNWNTKDIWGEGE